MDHARAQKDPLILELMAYRFRGHSVIDPARYRSSEELESWMRRDPVLLFRQRLLEASILTEEGVEAAEKEVQELVDACVAYADASPFPDVSTLFDYLYVEEGQS